MVHAATVQGHSTGERAAQPASPRETRETEGTQPERTGRLARREGQGAYLRLVPPPPPSRPVSPVCLGQDEEELLYLVRGETLSPYQRVLEGRYFLVNRLGIAGLEEGGFPTRAMADEVLARWTVVSTSLLARCDAHTRAEALHRYIHLLLRHQTFPTTPRQRRTVVSCRSAHPAHASVARAGGPSAPAVPAATSYVSLSGAEVCQALQLTYAQVEALVHHRLLRVESASPDAPLGYLYVSVAFWYLVLHGRPLPGRRRESAPPSPGEHTQPATSADTVPVPAHACLPKEGLHVAYHALIGALMQYYDVPERQLLTAPGRDPYMVEARAVIIMIMHQCWGVGVTAIATWIGRDHSTVRHHLKAYYDAPTPEFIDALGEVKRRIIAYLP